MKIVFSSEAPMSCVRKIKNELLEFPIPNRAGRQEVSPILFGKPARPMSIFDFAERHTPFLDEQDHQERE